MKSINLRILLASLVLLTSPNGWAESLHRAVTDNNIESVRLYLDTGADINQLGSSWYDYGSALHLAVQADYQDIAQLLIERGAAVDVRDNSDYTPLHNAAWSGSLDMVKLLLKSGADINARSYSGDTPLTCAYRKNRKDVIRFIETNLQSASN